MNGRRAAWIGTGVAAVAVILASSMNPVLSAGANGQLESRCSRDPTASWTYDRSSWTPLLWTCTVTWPDGSKSRFRASLP